MECISCSSTNLAACATTSGTLPSITCPVGVDACYTYVEGLRKVFIVNFKLGGRGGGKGGYGGNGTVMPFDNYILSVVDFFFLILIQSIVPIIAINQLMRHNRLMYSSHKCILHKMVWSAVDCIIEPQNYKFPQVK